MVTIFLLISLTFFSVKIDNSARYFLFLFANLSTIAIIHEMWAGRLRNFVNLMEFYPVRVIGKTSYGIYLYHNLVPEFFIRSPFSPSLPPSYVNVLVYLITTAIITVLSWKLIEKPCNLLKNSATNFVLRI
ncbi:hypothetical protein [Commensalibacter nepenthis]|uniref:Acyltransferase n=1 Tax=Commensalibacter nepenthis TaxID=3043872 RepID=A0ABT6Q6F3_9PROT|nr:hypothetical protein [Commensalibacter sp. TBRC 10068]MDI2112476.1 hypothetical protein [Commensalibacter sp. TBRC 10068]